MSETDNPLDGRQTPMSIPQFDVSEPPFEAVSASKHVASERSQHREVVPRPAHLDTLVPQAALRDDNHLLSYLDEEAEEHLDGNGGTRRTHRKRSILIARTSAYVLAALVTAILAAIIFVVMILRYTGKA